jgi:hypothetical protein
MEQPQVIIKAQYILDPQQERSDAAKQMVDQTYQCDSTIEIDPTVTPYCVAQSADYSADVLLQIAFTAQRILKQ